MKAVKTAFLLLFALSLLVPLAAFRRGAGIVSEIDNRMLQENPLGAEERAKGGDLTVKLEKYVQDRIGFRDEMILGYTALNDRLFGKMVHPSYCYGREGYVFAKMSPPVEYGGFHEAFADMVKKIQDYCEARGVPFLFVFEPSKSTILQEYLPAGVRYDAGWVDEFFQALDGRGVRYVDNRAVLQEKWDAGEAVFNRQYDAGHWNDLGAFYGVNAILEELRKDFSGVHMNTMEEIRVSEELQTSLPASKFPIRELTPLFEFPDMEPEDLTDSLSGEVRRDQRFRGFGRFVNPARLKEGTPRTLVFQGSYMNGRGLKFLQNGLGEYVFVHNYQNVIDFDYYFNIFQPECVVFEVTEYAMTKNYFDQDRMAAMLLAPPLEKVRAAAGEPEALPLGSVSVQRGEALTVVSWSGGDGSESFAWAEMGGTAFDLRRSDEGVWTATVKNEVWDQYGDGLQIAALAGGTLREYN